MMVKKYDLVTVIRSEAPLNTDVSKAVDKHEALGQINPLSYPI